MNKDEIFHETEQRIAEGDWTIMAIAGSCTCESCQSCQSLPSHDVPFFYTIGLYAKRLPELILFAHIHPHAAAHVVNAVADRLSEGKITVEDVKVDGPNTGGTFHILIKGESKSE